MLRSFRVRLEPTTVLSHFSHQKSPRFTTKITLCLFPPTLYICARWWISVWSLSCVHILQFFEPCSTFWKSCASVCILSAWFTTSLGFCKTLFNSMSLLQKVQVGESITKATPTSPATPNWIYPSRFYVSSTCCVSSSGVRESVCTKDSRRLPSSGHFAKKEKSSK